MTFEAQVSLDPVDWRLLELLQEDARLTFAELGRRVSLSPPAVAERGRQLETAGGRTGHHAKGYEAKLCFPRQAVARDMSGPPRPGKPDAQRGSRPARLAV